MIATGRLLNHVLMFKTYQINTQMRLTKMPRLNGPGLKLFLNTKRAVMGIAYATYNAVTEIAKIALIACAPANDNKPRMTEKKATNQTVLTGVLVKLFIRYR
jgi:hypothetical protein